jgi:hypothetical protein
MTSRFPSELGVRGMMRVPNRKEELARDDCSSLAKFPILLLANCCVAPSIFDLFRILELPYDPA